MSAVHEQKAKHCKAIMRKKNVVAVGVGFRKVKNRKSKVQCVVVSVTKKIPIVELDAKDVVPMYLEDQVLTDVIEVGEIKALARKAVPLANTDKVRPAPGGVSIGHVNITAGTLGCLVKNSNGTKVILSNNHVLANSNDARVGDAITQPGPHDGGVPQSDKIGTLSEFAPITFTRGCFLLQFLKRVFNIKATPNLVDAALCMPTISTSVTSEIKDIGNPTGAAPAELGDKVKKSGRTTELTTGQILQTDVTVTVQYGEGKTATFEDQLMGGAMSQGGDSGSALLNENNQVVGLLFAGSDTTTIFNRIENVFDAFNLQGIVT